jgi:hypothetical protein
MLQGEAAECVAGCHSCRQDPIGIPLREGADGRTIQDGSISAWSTRLVIPAVIPPAVTRPNLW